MMKNDQFSRVLLASPVILSSIPIEIVIK
jgi:hypothetical protein